MVITKTIIYSHTNFIARAHAADYITRARVPSVLYAVAPLWLTPSGLMPGRAGGLALMYSTR